MTDYHEIFEKIPDGVTLHDATDGTLLDTNQQFCEMLGYTREELLAVDFDTLHVDEPPYTSERAHEYIQKAATEGPQTFEWRDKTKAGDPLPVEVNLRQTTIDGERRILAVVRDITERKQRERDLREQQQSVDTILEHVPAVLFTLDADGVFTRSEGQSLQKIGLSPGEAVGQSVFDMYADFPGILDACRRALDGETVTSSVDVAGRAFEVTYQPVFDGGDNVDQVVGFAYDVTEQKERERMLEHQRASLERIQQITDSLRPLNRALARVSTRDEIEQVVCEQLATSDAYILAWYGNYNPATQQITVQTSTGVDDEGFDGLGVSTDRDESQQKLFDQVVHTRDVQAVRNVSPGDTFEPWPDAAIDSTFRSIAAIPVAFGGTLYGVIAVYSGRPDAFDDYERGLLRELGERIGNGIRAAENERLLRTDTVVELEFEITGRESVLVRVTEDLDCRINLETILPTAENTYLCYATVTRSDPAIVVESLSNSPDIDRARVVDSAEETGTIEYRLHESPVATLLSYGASVTSHVADAGTETIVGEVAPDADTHTIIEGMQETTSNTTFVAKRSIDRPVQSIEVSSNAFDDVLTDRQREALTLAYHGGFFDSPRASTGDELAEALCVSSPTFYLHVRKATQRIVEQMDQLDLLN